MQFIDLGNSREIKIIPSNQLTYYKISHKSKILNDVLKETCSKIKYFFKFAIYNVDEN